MFDKWPDFDELEVGFPEQRALFDLLTALNGTLPPVIDSDDLLENPDRMVEAFCDAVGISFIPEAMTWEPGGDPSAHSWWDGGSFHANLAQSTGLTPQASLCRGCEPRNVCAACIAYETTLRSSLSTKDQTRIKTYWQNFEGI